MDARKLIVLIRNLQIAFRPALLIWKNKKFFQEMFETDILMPYLHPENTNTNIQATRNVTVIMLYKLVTNNKISHFMLLMQID